MIFPIDDSILDEKNKVQKKILEEANGDLCKYTEIIKKEADELRKNHKNKFNKVYKMEEKK